MAELLKRDYDIIALKTEIGRGFGPRTNAAQESLELATAGDYANPLATEGSVKIRADQLVDLSTQLANLWLLALNCCSSGQAARNLQSMAHQVVSAGFPAAVAMSEPVNADDAFEFTRAFYRSLFRSLTTAAKKLKTDKRVPFEWTEAMFDARTALCDPHNGDAPNAREWALPVLYVRGVDPFHFERPHAEPEDGANVFKVRARIVAEWLRDAARAERGAAAGRNETRARRRTAALLARARRHVSGGQLRGVSAEG
ncbi:MAG TPA: CHAT domain-containing protein [Burkholderiaceae bacterium]|nr:CHAT domain-containing protein [Burkholderiaceae bacterium]